MIGDPLYQPFKSNIKISEGTDDGYKEFKVAVLKNQLDLLSDSIKDPSLMESIGLHLMIDKDYQGAEKSFNLFRTFYSILDRSKQNNSTRDRYGQRDRFRTPLIARHKTISHRA